MARDSCLTSINDTGGKLATGTAGVVDTGAKLPPVSIALEVNLPPVSTTPGENNGKNIRLLSAYTLKCP